MSDRQLDIMTEHYNYLESKKEFKSLFRSNVKENHDMMVVNFSNNRKTGLYLNKNFLSNKSSNAPSFVGSCKL